MIRRLLMFQVPMFFGLTLVRLRPDSDVLFTLCGVLIVVAHIFSVEVPNEQA